MKLEDYVNKSIENRAEFLKSYKDKFDSLDPEKNRRKRAEIIVELLQLEIDHLKETWIQAEVIKWHRTGCQDYIDKAFRIPTKKRRYSPIRDAKLFDRVERLRKQGLSIRRACEKLAEQFQQRDAKTVLMYDMLDPDFDLSVAIRNCYNKHKKRLKNDLPRPYYGSDISVNLHET